MKIVSNLNIELHKRLENHILNINSIPLIINFFKEYDDESLGKLETFELINFKYENDTYFLIYEPKELKESTKETIAEFKQLRLL